MKTGYSEDALRELELQSLMSWLGQRAATRSVSPEAVPDSPAQAEPAAWHEVAPRGKAVVPAQAATKPAAAGLTPARPGLGQADWQALRASVEACRECGLCKARKQAVFGAGSQTGPWLIVGEGPGADEDAQGEPFVGQAGKLLDAMLASIQLSRVTNAYIANVVKCRPPGNRTPTPEEAAACAPYLDRQIDLISPKLIVALGKTAAVRFLGSDGSLASLRGKVHDYRGFPLVISYHPAYLLRNPPDKAKVWEDLLLAKRTLQGL